MHASNMFVEMLNSSDSSFVGYQTYYDLYPVVRGLNVSEIEEFVKLFKGMDTNEDCVVTRQGKHSKYEQLSTTLCLK